MGWYGLALSFRYSKSRTQQISTNFRIASKNNRQVGADISTWLGLIFWNLGILSKALEYDSRSLGIHKELNDRVGLAGDYKNIGNVLGDMGKNQEALESHNKALEIDKELNDRVGLARLVFKEYQNNKTTAAN